MLRFGVFNGWSSVLKFSSWAPPLPMSTSHLPDVIHVLNTPILPYLSLVFTRVFGKMGEAWEQGYRKTRRQFNRCVNDRELYCVAPTYPLKVFHLLGMNSERWDWECWVIDCSPYPIDNVQCTFTLLAVLSFLHPHTLNYHPFYPGVTHMRNDTRLFSPFLY